MKNELEKKSIGKRIKDYLTNALSGMALGLFSTLIIGLIIQQIGKIFGDSQIGKTLISFGVIASAVTGGAIGVGIAGNINASKLATYSSVVTGMIGAHASALISGKLFLEGKVLIPGAGDPLGAMIAVMVGIEVSRLVAGKTKVDILLVPFTTIVSGAIVAYFVGAPLSSFTAGIGGLIIKATELQPFLMGIIVSALMGTCLTSPLSSAALSFILQLKGLPAGAATVGCCCQMIGFAAASFRENGFGGVIAQGIGTSKIQLPNVIKNFWIFIPSLGASIILGPVATVLFKMENNPAGAGMGTSGFVGQIMTYQTMTEAGFNSGVILIKIIILHFVLPAIIAFTISEVLRKKGLIKDGDMKLSDL